MINDPQTISLADAVAGMRERDASTAPAAAPPLPLAGAPIDAIALGAAFRAGASTSLADAAKLALSAETAADAPGLASGNAAALQTTVAELLRDLATVPGGGGHYADPSLMRGMTALIATIVTQGAAALGGPPALAGLTAVLRAALSVPEPALAASFAGQLRTLLAGAPTALTTALVTLEPNVPASSTAPIVIPAYDLSARTFDPAAPRAQNVAYARADVRSAVVAIPDRDPYGRRYTEAARRRLVQLGMDPRHGFAPEAQAAVAAEERWGVSFVRCLDARHDFIDGTGRVWDVLAPRSAERFGTALDALAQDAGVLVFAAAAGEADRSRIFAAIARRPVSPQMQPIVAVDGPAEDSWPG